MAHKGPADLQEDQHRRISTSRLIAADEAVEADEALVEALDQELIGYYRIFVIFVVIRQVINVVTVIIYDIGLFQN